MILTRPEVNLVLLQGETGWPMKQTAFGRRFMACREVSFAVLHGVAWCRMLQLRFRDKKSTFILLI